MNIARKLGLCLTAFTVIGLAAAGSVAQAFQITITEAAGDQPITYQLPNAVGSGDLVLLETGTDQSRSNWSDVLRFNNDGNNLATTATMFSDLDFSTWNLDSRNAFITENTNGDTVFFANPNTYDIFSDERGGVPEPSQALSLAIGVLGLGGLALFARKRRQTAA